MIVAGTRRFFQVIDRAAPGGSAGIGIDITEQMLAAARDHGRASQAHLLLADARHLPLLDAVVDVVFAAGLIGWVIGVLMPAVAALPVPSDKSSA